MGLISLDASGPTSADIPSNAWLGDVAHLQALQEPTRRLDLTPRPILQRQTRRSWLYRNGASSLATVGVHVAFAAAFLALLSFRDPAPAPGRETEIPVEVVQEAPKPPAPAGAKVPGAPGNGPPQASGPTVDPTKPVSPGGAPLPQPKPPAATQDAKLAPPLSPPSSPPPSPPAPAPKAAGKPDTPAAPPADAVAPPKLVAPPPDAARSATQDKENKPANLVPDAHQTDQATHEAKPVAMPEVLTTHDPMAETSVPTPVKAPPAQVDKPTPPIPARAPSAADKLAAALPMDISAMPMSFRSVLAGNAAAQINAAYAGVVQGRIRQAQAEFAEAAYSQRLSGNVAVAFTVDDSGKLSGLSIVQSSGDAKLDALALHSIELAAPFPPPPPEADHTFRKAFLVGG